MAQASRVRDQETKGVEVCGSRDQEGVARELMTAGESRDDGRGEKYCFGDGPPMVARGHFLR